MRRRRIIKMRRIRRRRRMRMNMRRKMRMKSKMRRTRRRTSTMRIWASGHGIESTASPLHWCTIAQVLQVMEEKSEERTKYLW